MDADVCHARVQLKKQRRAVHHLRELRAEWVPVLKCGDGQGPGEPAQRARQAGRRLRGAQWFSRERER